MMNAACYKLYAQSRLRTVEPKVVPYFTSTKTNSAMICYKFQMISALYRRAVHLKRNLIWCNYSDSKLSYMGISPVAGYQDLPNGLPIGKAVQQTVDFR